MDDKEIVLYSDAPFGAKPFGPGVDINIGIVRHDALNPGALDMRGYLYFMDNYDICVFLYIREDPGTSWMEIHKTVPRDTPLCDLTQELYLLVLMGFDTGETDYEKDVRLALFQSAQGAHLLEIARARVKLKLREKSEENARYGRKKGGVAR